MLGMWNAEMGALFYETLDSLTWTSGNASRTIGTSGDFNVARPLEIIGAQYRDSGSSDYTLAIISHREYQEITTKTVQTAIPSHLAYNPTISSGLGTLFIWPVPQADFTFRLNSRKPLADLTGSGTVTLPPGFEDAIVNNLALRLCDFSGIDPTPVLVKNAQRSFAALERAGKQFNMAKIDPLLPGQSTYYNPRAHWNI